MNNLKSYYNIGTDTEIIIQIIVNGKFKNMIKKKIHRKSNPMLNFFKRKKKEKEKLKHTVASCVSTISKT